jgi:hypothetical protein
MPMSRFMDATASFTGVSLEMPKKVRSAETLSAKDGDAITTPLVSHCEEHFIGNLRVGSCTQD